MRMSHSPNVSLRRLGLVAVAVVACSTTVAPSSAGAQDAAQPAAVTSLSNETTLSRWAYPVRLGPIYANASKASRRVANLRLLTEDRLPELYLLLKQTTDASGQEWVQIRVPKRPSGATGWVERSSLGDFHVVHKQLVISRSRLRVTLYDSGKRVFSAPVGVGKAGTVTPAGHFFVREKFRVTGAPFYGPYAIGTSAYSPTLTDWPNGGVVGMHGTSVPSLIPGRPSHGCVRLRNGDITRLYRMLPLGTPVRIT